MQNRFLICCQLPLNLETGGKSIQYTAPNNIAMCLSIATRHAMSGELMYNNFILPALAKNDSATIFDRSELSKLYDYFELIQIE